jgi:hypothetical protein
LLTLGHWQRSNLWFTYRKRIRRQRIGDVLKSVLIRTLFGGAEYFEPADETPWQPAGTAPGPHERLTLLGRAVLLEELRQRKPLLVLHLVLRRDEPPVQVGPSAQLGSSFLELPLGD